MTLRDLICKVLGHKRLYRFTMPVVSYVCPRCWKVVAP